MCFFAYTRSFIMKSTNTWSWRSETEEKKKVQFRWLDCFELAKPEHEVKPQLKLSFLSILKAKRLECSQPGNIWVAIAYLIYNFNKFYGEAQHGEIKVSGLFLTSKSWDHRRREKYSKHELPLKYFVHMKTLKIAEECEIIHTPEISHNAPAHSQCEMRFERNSRRGENLSLFTPTYLMRNEIFMEVWTSWRLGQKI